MHCCVRRERYEGNLNILVSNVKYVDEVAHQFLDQALSSLLEIDTAHY
jgi:hypothetical protein